MGSRWLDTVGLAEPEAFWRVIDSHAHVRAVVWGHVHQAVDGQRGGVGLFATPSTGAQFLPRASATRSIRGRPRTGTSTWQRTDASKPRSTGSTRCRCTSPWRADAPPSRLSPLSDSVRAVALRHGARGRRAAFTLGIAWQTQYGVSARLHSRAAPRRLPAGTRRAGGVRECQIRLHGSESGRDQFGPSAG